MSSQPRRSRRKPSSSQNSLCASAPSSARRCCKRCPGRLTLCRAAPLPGSAMSCPVAAALCWPRSRRTSLCSHSRRPGAGQRATLSALVKPGMKAVTIRVNDVEVGGFVSGDDDASRAHASARKGIGHHSGRVAEHLGARGRSERRRARRQGGSRQVGHAGSRHQSMPRNYG